MKKFNKILFISVDGPQNYMKSLFFPILFKLNDDYNKISILEFCPNDKNLKKDLTSISKLKNLKIYFGLYFNKPPVIGSLLFILSGVFRVNSVIKKEKINVLMPRSLLAGIMVLAIKKLNNDIKIIYESDGLMSDERVDFAGWSREGILYKIFQYFEKSLIIKSDYVVTRTKAAKKIFLERTSEKYSSKIFVIPNGKDLNDFKDVLNQPNFLKNKYNLPSASLIMTYVGSIGKQYQPEKMIEIHNFLNSKKINLYFLILTPNINEINNIVLNLSKYTSKVVIDKVDPSEIPLHLGSSDFGIALRTPTFSQKGVCPLKVIEYLLSNKPLITNSGIGDMDEILSTINPILIVNELIFNDLNILLSKVKEFKDYRLSKNTDIQVIANNHFNLNDTVKKYKELLNEI